MPSRQGCQVRLDDPCGGDDLKSTLFVQFDGIGPTETVKPAATSLTAGRELRLGTVLTRCWLLTDLGPRYPLLYSRVGKLPGTTGEWGRRIRRPAGVPEWLIPINPPMQGDARA
jgi:hypothetical protein